MATLNDFVVVCGLSADGGYDGSQETDWFHFGIPVHKDEIWELQFQCCHKSGAPNATVIGSFVAYGADGSYVGTTLGPIQDLTDSTAWQLYTFQNKFVGTRYVFPAIWWNAATPLSARYLAGVQMAQVVGAGSLVVVQPDIYLTLGTDPATSGKYLASDKAKLGPP